MTRSRPSSPITWFRAWSSYPAPPPRCRSCSKSAFTTRNDVGNGTTAVMARMAMRNRFVLSNNCRRYTVHWLDPDYLPKLSGTFECFLLNPHGDADGMILTDGIEV